MDAPRDLTRIASVMVFASACAWGLIWWPVRYFEDQDIPGAWAVAAMNLAAMLLLMGVVARDWRRQKPQLAHAFPVGLAAGLAFACYFAGLIHTSVIRATLLFYLTPIWGTLLGIWWLGERADARRWGAIVLGLFGLLLLVRGDAGQPLNAGDALAFASGIIWAVGGTLLKARPNVPIAGMTMIQHFCLMVATLILGWMLNDLGPLPGTALRANALPIIGFALGLFLPAVVLLFWASRILYPGRVAILLMPEVYVALISASLLLPDERLVALQWLGAAFIVLAGLIEILPARRANIGLRNRAE